MAFSTPASASVLGNAERVRTVYFPALGQTFHAWSWARGGKSSFAIRPFPGTNWDEAEVYPGVFTVRSFYVVRHPTLPTRAIFLWDDGKRIYSLVWDVVAQEITTPAAVLTDGTIPVGANDGELKLLYLRNADVKVRTNLTGDEEALVTLSSARVEDFDATTVDPEDFGAEPTESGATLFYAGQHRAEVARAVTLLTIDATELLFRSDVDMGLVVDHGPEALDTALPVGWFATPAGLVVSPGASLAPATLLVSSEVTIEILLTPRMNTRAADLVSGDLRLSYDQRGRLEFAFLDGPERVWRQSKASRVTLTPHRRNHVGVSHAFGSAASTLVVIDGKAVQGSWVSGTGNEDPGFTGVDVGFGGSPFDVLHAIRVLSATRAADAFEAYAAGRER